MFRPEEGCKEIWGLLGWQYQPLASVHSGLQSLERCRDTGLWTQTHANSPKKGSRAGSDGEGPPGLKVLTTHKCSSPEEEHGKWGLIAHLYSQPQEVKP